MCTTMTIIIRNLIDRDLQLVYTYYYIYTIRIRVYDHIIIYYTPSLLYNTRQKTIDYILIKKVHVAPAIHCINNFFHFVVSAKQNQPHFSRYFTLNNSYITITLINIFVGDNLTCCCILRTLLWLRLLQNVLNRTIKLVYYLQSCNTWNKIVQCYKHSEIYVS